MEFATFEPIDTDYTAKVDMDILADSYKTLQQRHDNTIAAASKLKETVANMEMDESEWALKGELYSGIKTAIDSKIQSIGNDENYGDAYNDIVALTGSYISDPRVTGRIKANKSHESYINTLNARTDINEDTKSYYRDVNKYKYQDPVDENGNVNGEYKWEVSEDAVSSMDISDLYSKAIELTATEQGNWNSTRFLDENGNVTTDPLKARFGEYFDQTTGSYVRLKEEDIARTLNTLIDSNPAYGASIDQDMKVDSWLMSKGANANNSERINRRTDENGILLSRQGYVDKLVRNISKEAAYNHQKTVISYGNANAKYQEYKQKAMGAGSVIAKANMYGATSKAGVYSIDSGVTVGSSMRAIESNKDSIVSKFNEYKKDNVSVIDFPDNTTELGKDFITSNFNVEEGSKEYANIYSEITKYNKYVQSMNSKLDQIDYTKRDEFKSLDGIVNGNFNLEGRSEDVMTPEEIDIRNSINSMFKDGNDEYKIKLHRGDIAKVNDYFSNVLKIDNLQQAFGVTIDGGIMTLSKENYNSLPKFFNEFERAIDDNGFKWLGRRIIVGNYITDVGFNLNLPKEIKDIARSYRSAENKVNQISSESLSDYEVEVVNLGFETPHHLENLMQYSEGKLKDGQFNTLNKAASSALRSVIKGTANYDDLSLFSIDNNGQMVDISAEERNAIMDAVKQGIDSNEDYNISMATANGLTHSKSRSGYDLDAGFLITVPKSKSSASNEYSKSDGSPGAKKGETSNSNSTETNSTDYITYYIAGNGISDRGMDELMNDESFVVKSDLRSSKNGVLGKEQVYANRDSNSLDFVAEYSGNTQGNDLYRLFINGGSIELDHLSEWQATDIITSARRYHEAIDLAKNSAISKEDFNYYKNSLINVLSKVNGLDGNQIEELINNDIVEATKQKRSNN